MKVYLGNKLVDSSDAKVSVFDHGLLYGDGVFEGIRLYKNCLFRLDEHLERLEQSAKSLMLNIPLSKEDLKKAIVETCEANNLKNGYIRLVVTRGIGNLGLSIQNCDSPQVIIIADKIQLYPKEFYNRGLKIITVATRRNNHAALPPTIKSLNYLNNILAKIEAQNLGFQEALMLNDQGYISECTGDNVFIVSKGKLFTPKVSSGALEGITRQVVFEIAKEFKIDIIEDHITRQQVWISDELFLTGTAAEVIPIVEVDSRIIGDGKPGSITDRILKEFRVRACIDGFKF